MKTEQQVREMVRAINAANESGMVRGDLAVAQVMALAWVLEALPPKAIAFQEAVLTKDPSAMRFARSMVLDDGQEPDAIWAAMRAI